MLSGVIALLLSSLVVVVFLLIVCAAALWSRLPIASASPAIRSWVRAALLLPELLRAVILPRPPVPHPRGVRVLPFWVGLPSFFSWLLWTPAADLGSPSATSFRRLFQGLDAGLQLVGLLDLAL